MLSLALSGVLLASAFLASCSREEKEEKNVRKDPVVEPTIPYRSKCLDFSHGESCGRSETEAALYDYSASVYLPANRPKKFQIRYNERLNPFEKEAVVKFFGGMNPQSSLGQEDSAKTFLKNLHDQMMPPASYPVPGYCGALTFRSGRDFYLLGGAHGCGVNYFDDYLQKGIELSVASSPNSWIFFIEGIEQGIPNDNIIPELMIFRKIARQLNIPAFDPQKFNASHPKTREWANQKYKRGIEAYIGQVLAGDLLIKLELGQKISLKLLPLYVEKITARNAPNFPEYSRDQLKNLMLNHLGQKEDETEAEFYQRIMREQTLGEAFSKKESAMMKEISEAAEELSSIYIQQVIRENPQRNKYFFQVGTYHADLPEKVGLK